MDIAEFLKLRLDEDEAVARWTQRGYQHVLGIRHYFSANNETSVAMTPRTALAEVAAKRRIVELHGRRHECSQHEDGEVDAYAYVDSADCDTLKLLASVWREHEDWREEWPYDRLGD